MPRRPVVAPLATFGLIVLILVSLAGLANSASANDALPDVTLQANAELIDAVHRQYIGRDATDAERERWLQMLGINQTETDLRAHVLGTKTFFRRFGGAGHRTWIDAVHQAVDDRPATGQEIRRYRRALRAHPVGGQAARKKVAGRVLRREGVDADGFQIQDVQIVRNDDRTVDRIIFDVNRRMVDGTAALDVFHDGVRVDGQLQIRNRGRRAVLYPDATQTIDGVVLATAFTWTDGVVLRADTKLAAQPRWERERMFPDRRIVAYYGNHITPLLGVLGETGPERAVERVKAAAAPFSEPGRPAVGAFEMIVTVAQGSAGADGNYSHPSNIDDLRPWIDIAEREGLYVILDIQPGTSDFFTETIRYESLLKEPHVGLALDPEWRMAPGQRPGSTVGSVTAEEVNQVSKWLSDLVIANDLPEKMFIVHQFQTRMIKDRETMIDRPGLATIIHADGFGGRAIKLQTYGILQVDPPWWNGFKLFIDEDTRIFQPADVLAFDTVPVPDLITYQ